MITQFWVTADQAAPGFSAGGQRVLYNGENAEKLYCVNLYKPHGEEHLKVPLRHFKPTHFVHKAEGQC